MNIELGDSTITKISGYL